MANLIVRFDCTAVDAALDAVSSALAAAPEVEGLVNQFFDAFKAGDQLLFVQRDQPVTTGAGEAVIFLDPSDGLLGLLTALGAGDV